MKRRKIRRLTKHQRKGHKGRRERNNQNPMLYIIIILLLFWIGYTYKEPLAETYKKANSSIKESLKPYFCHSLYAEYQYPSSEESSIKAIELINSLRKQHGKNTIIFDKRVFELAKARARDMRENFYLDHTNPKSGTCPDNMKTQYGLRPYEFVAENVFGNPERPDPNCTIIEQKPITDPLDSWMESRGHRYNLLYDYHTAGAVGCYENMCVFLGLNNKKFGEGCHKAADGVAFWAEAAIQPGEV